MCALWHPLALPLNPPQVLAGGEVVCIRHAPWARCAGCGRVATHGEASGGDWLYLVPRDVRALGRRHPAWAWRLARRRAGERWLCPACRDRLNADRGRPGAAPGIVWWLAGMTLALLTLWLQAGR